MRRRRWVLVLLAFVLGACSSGAAEPGRDRPNILIIVTDDERIESEAGRPNVHNWFKGGTTFTHAFATTPQCCPSRASILTGQYAHNHDVHRKRDAESIIGTRTIEASLAEAGVRWCVKLGRDGNQRDFEAMLSLGTRAAGANA